MAPGAPACTCFPTLKAAAARAHSPHLVANGSIMHSWPRESLGPPRGRRGSGEPCRSSEGASLSSWEKWLNWE